MEIADHLRKYKFDMESSNNVEERVLSLSNEFHNKDKAREVLIKSLRENVRGLFSNRQLENFLNTIRKEAFFPLDFEIEKVTGLYPFEFNDLRRNGELSKEEIRDYFIKRDKYANETRDSRN